MSILRRYSMFKWFVIVFVTSIICIIVGSGVLNHLIELLGVILLVLSIVLGTITVLLKFIETE